MDLATGQHPAEPASGGEVSPAPSSPAELAPAAKGRAQEKKGRRPPLRGDARKAHAAAERDRRAAKRLEREAQAAKLERRLSESVGQPPPKAPELAPAPSPAAPPAPVQLAPAAPPPPRPGWPTDAEIAAALPNAEAGWAIVATLTKGTKLERCFSGDTSTLVNGAMVEVPKIRELARLTAPLVAKYFSTESAPMEVQCGLGIAAIVLAPLLQDFIQRKLEGAGSSATPIPAAGTQLQVVSA